MKTACDAMLVLGLQLNADDSPREELRLRIRGAEEAYRKGLAQRIIACGGATGTGAVTEAQVIRRFLTDDGIPPSAIVLEDRSTMTVENFMNARAMLPAVARPTVLVVTSSYHMLRARLICRKCGMRSVPYKVSIPREMCKTARRFEPLHTIDFLLGYQDGTRQRPEWYTRLMHRLMHSAPPGRGNRGEAD